MSDYTWPNFGATRFVMRIAPLTKAFASPYSNQVQSIDMLAECWVVEIDLAPEVSTVIGLAIEAFFDRLKGTANRIILSNLKVVANQGTMRGSPVLTTAVGQLANLLPITTTPFATALPGDMLGAGGQLFRVLAPATADSAGHMNVEVAPRVRSATGIGAGAAVTWNQPTAAFRLSSGNPAVEWHPGEFVAPAISMREDF